MKPIYTGLFLGDQNHDLFRELAENVWKGLMDNLYLHHMTIKFRPSPGDVEAVPIGGYIPVKLVGYTNNSGRAQAFTVMPTRQMAWVGSLVRPHITVATEPGVPPKDSHEAIKEGVSLFSDDENEELLECPYMDEVVHKWHYLRCGWYDGKNVHYNKDELW